MKLWRLALLLGALTTGCPPSEGARAEVKVDGSSTVYPITEAVAEELRKVQPSIRVTVGISGTGGGFKKLAAREVDIAGASRPIKPSEVEACRAAGVAWVELPVAFDGIAVVVHPSNTWARTMTVDELRRLWAPEAQNVVRRWRDLRPDWPDREVHLFGAGVDSGTYDYFTNAIVGREHASRGDYTSSEDDNVLCQGVASDPDALGFFGLAYYEANHERLAAVAIDDGDTTNGAGPIAPSSTTIRDGTYQPLARPVFIYARVEALERPEVAAFADFYLQHAGALSTEVGYVALSALVYELAQERLRARRPGSSFAGSTVGLRIEDVMARAPTDREGGAQRRPSETTERP
jgi:phosphate transport system substrate-binding protein